MAPLDKAERARRRAAKLAAAQPVEIHGDAAPSGMRACALDQRRGGVHPERTGAASRQRGGEKAGTAGDVDREVTLVEDVSRDAACQNSWPTVDGLRPPRAPDELAI